MNTKTLTAIAVVLAVIPALSFAQQGGAQMRPQAPQIDFATADADASGGISADEWTAYVTAQRAERRAAAMATRADALIAVADADGDAALSRDELITGFTAMAEQRREARTEARAEGRTQGRGMGDFGGRNDRGDRNDRRDCDARGDRGDRDYGHGRGYGHDRGYGHGRDYGHGRGYGHDRGNMERGNMERGDRAAQMFDRIDQNSDGQIDVDELNTLQERMQSRLGRRNN